MCQLQATGGICQLWSRGHFEKRPLARLGVLLPEKTPAACFQSGLRGVSLPLQLPPAAKSMRRRKERYEAHSCQGTRFPTAIGRSFVRAGFGISLIPTSGNYLQSLVEGGLCVIHAACGPPV